MKKSNQNMIKLLKELHAKRTERIKDTGAILISKLSNVVVEQMNSKAACLELCEKKIEEKKEKPECKIEEINCSHDTEIVLLKKEIKYLAKGFLV